MEVEARPIATAGLLPLDSVLAEYAMYYPPSVDFSYIFHRFVETAAIDRRFHICSLRDITNVSDLIQSVSGLSIDDRLTFAYAPYSKDQRSAEVMRAFAKCVAKHESGHLLDIPEIPLEILDEAKDLSKEYLQRLEGLHRAVILYLWLGYRFAGCFVDRDLALHVRGIIEARMDEVLAESSASPVVRQRILEQNRRARAATELLNEDIGSPNMSSSQGNDGAKASVRETMFEPAQGQGQQPLSEMI